MNFIPLRDLGPFGTNCYILLGEDGDAALIDAPYSAEQISRALEEQGVKRLRAVLLTHGHCDHIEALGGLKERWGCEVYIHAADLGMLSDERASLAAYFGTPFEPFYGAKALTGGERLDLCGHKIEVLHTPGHSPGSVCYIAGETVFCGDTIFEGTVGRTDLGGDFGELIKSVGRLIEKCGGAALQPGHGEPTELMFELRHNPYLSELRKKLL